MRSSTSNWLGFITLLACFLVNQFSLSFAYFNSHLLHRIGDDRRRLLTDEEHWFNQTLDHFSPYGFKPFGANSHCRSQARIKEGSCGRPVTANVIPCHKKNVMDQHRMDHRQFNQRYYEFLDYFRSPDGPIFLTICGEAACRGIRNDYIAVLAKKFGAAIVSPEHRYYGKSSPFESRTTENLKYLSSKQALFDLAAFRQYYQDSLNQRLNRSNVENSWFVFGGSYAGALSAWFRLKFPHLTCGSLASSGVVLAVFNYTDFDRQIGVSAGPECKAILQEVTQLVDERLESNEKATKAAFNASELTVDGDFLYLLADAAAIAFQYGNPEKLCSPLVEAKKDGRDLVDAYASYVKDYYLGSFGVSVKAYTQEFLKDTTASETSSDRLWWFQVCSEVAYFQVAPANDSIRSSKVDTKYHLDLCKNVFGDGVYPEVETTNLYYGGTKIAGSKIVFTNGSQDPWRHASKPTSSPGLPSYLISCHNCGHCSDLSGCPQAPMNPEGDSSKCSNPDALNKVRQQVTEHIDLWLSECQDASRGWSSV